MKSFVFVFLILIGSVVIAQEQSFHYKFKLDGVIDLPTAKEIKDPLRAKFLCYTVYDDVAQQFDFVSTVNVNENQLQQYLDDYGYVITEFQKLPVVTQINNEK
ncbi:MAG: hypothetical protein IPM77_17305 [Crocinitomicaceae bacterium]|nr:hypothetical protein [Crocinitomicaceae bacterium]